MQKVGFAGAVAALAAGALIATPATAQFFMKSKDLRGERIRGDETGIGQMLPGATADEQRAAVVWNMRAALNVAALQCQFEPSLLTVQNYNAILADHKQELATSYTALTKYFERIAKTKKGGQNALDQFGTRTYSGFATVAAQYGFCTTTSSIGREALYTPRGGFGDVALSRMREVRNSLTPWGEQQFPRMEVYLTPAYLPRFDKACWKKDEFVVKKCGQPFGQVAYAAR
ncbi:hypothetical protein ASE95_05350 [Sphingomonas sp. Leaf231]|uniref:hypothetical protein n=1 Tax=Sphingomonas sp. Leaf231 TaxID=1736301 RepID=UPI0006F6EEED|nr:hypothetical protein [Sphingomonas sp. Leaf231]KQN94268.1 hypothetical protein ASE95_05350 [Sphingomonas sp. Leaf231]